jgi:antitoxin CcdA
MPQQTCQALAVGQRRQVLVSADNIGHNCLRGGQFDTDSRSGNTATIRLPHAYNAHQSPTFMMRIGSNMKPAHVTSPATKVPSKKATNISLAMDVYLDAKNFGINISQVCEQRLREEIQARKEQQWNEQHADFIAAYNSLVEADGVALQEWRAF